MSNASLIASGATARTRRRNTLVLIVLLAVVTAALALGMWHAIREVEASAASGAPTTEATN
jgi:predicted metal-binding membrane protein